MNTTNLKEYSKSLTNEDVIKLFHKLAKELSQYDKNNKEQQDYKTSIIFLDDNYQARYINANNSPDNVSFDFSSQKVISLSYMPPEISKSTDQHREDAWSLGLAMLKICLKKPKPVLIYSEDEEKQRTIKENLLRINSLYGSFLTGLISKLLTLEAKRRPTIEWIIEMLEEKFSSLKVIL